MECFIQIAHGAEAAAPGSDKQAREEEVRLVTGFPTPHNRLMSAAAMTIADPNADIPGLPFEKALAELEAIVQRLEQGKVDLEESITIYERGEALKRHCQTLLERADARIQKITIGPDGQAAGTTPLDVES